MKGFITNQISLDKLNSINSGFYRNTWFLNHRMTENMFGGVHFFAVTVFSVKTFVKHFQHAWLIVVDKRYRDLKHLCHRFITSISDNRVFSQYPCHCVFCKKKFVEHYQYICLRRSSLADSVRVRVGIPSQTSKRKMKKKISLRRFPFSRFLAKTLRVNKLGMERFLKKSVVRSRR